MKTKHTFDINSKILYTQNKDRKVNVLESLQFNKVKR